MNKPLIHGGIPEAIERPTPIISFSKIWAEGRYWQPQFGDRHALLLLRRKMPDKVSFIRAYRGFRASGAREEKELGEGRAFLRWLQRHEISIDWKKNDFAPHPYFSHPLAPKHDPLDEMAQGLSFAIRPVSVQNRKVKLYVGDNDMMNLLSMPYGNEEDFLELVMRYVSMRFEWEKWRAPAPVFLDWVKSQGLRPIFVPGQVGLCLNHLT